MSRLNIPVTTPNTKIYNPGAAGQPHAVISNNSSSALYLGGSSVTAATGLWFPPGAKIEYPYAPYAIYAVDGGVTAGTVVNTTTSNAYAAGAGTVVVASGTGIVANQVLFIASANSNTGAEAVTVSSQAGGTVVLVSPTQFDHLTGSTVTTIVSQSGGAVYVDQGAT